ncbi:ATP-binding protein [Nocardia brasiliensis]|uniref:ATP-binding protein n=1 Tax=Nocardia brasiliensis TaxID=37326 RepID=UPI0011DE13B6|nr:ATP-binding protein [Nocardia brasiliensis]
MSISVVRVSSQQVSRILSLEEGQFGDLKSIDIAPAALTKTLSAFANADGGEIFIGIDEVSSHKRRWRGFDDLESANGHIQIFDLLFPLGGEHDYEFLEADRAVGKILHVTIQKSTSIKVASNGKPYVRRGAQNIPADNPEAMDRLRRAKGLTSFETETIAYPIDELTNSMSIIRFMIDLVPTADPEPWLKKQLLIRGGLPTVGGVLLFSDEPQVALPKRSSIKVYRYKTTDSEGTREALTFDPITIEGSLYDQIYAAIDKVVEIVEQTKVASRQGLSQIKYPREAIHEIITNAVIHRDYGLADDVHIRIFDNRIEVESPGRLPAHITPDNILDERFARNGTIVRLINKFPNPPNKDVGEGLNTAFNAMKALKLKAPIISELPNSVLVNIRHERLASPEEICMEYLETHDEIRNRTLRELTGIGSENAVKRVFQRLIAAQQIERVPGKFSSASAYRKWTGSSDTTSSDRVGSQGALDVSAKPDRHKGA